MSVNPSALGPKPQFELSTGLPAVGNLLFFYVAGSVGTKQTTYTDSTGGSANTNPIVLNSLGQPTNEIWWTAGQNYKVVYAPSTDTDPPTSPIWTIDNLKGINDSTGTVDQWVAGPTPTYISATSFSLAGDQTSTFQVARRIKTTNTGGTVYGTISTSVFGAVTTVTVVNDSGTLDSGLSAVSYGLLSASNASIPAWLKFPATQVASSDANTLDDYKEALTAVGWVPTIGGSTSETGQVYSGQTGTAIKLGRLVIANFSVSLSTLGTITGNVLLKGLPFTALNVALAAGSAAIRWAGTTSNFVEIQATVTANSTSAALVGTAAAGTQLVALVQADLSAVTNFTGTIIYFAAT